MEDVIIEDLNFSYDGEKQIFEHVSLTFNRGTIYLLTGDNGSGKTTLLQVISGLIFGGSVDRILWSSREYKRFTELKNEVLYVNETPYLYDYLTGEENLNLIMDIFHIQNKREKVLDNVRKFKIIDTLDRLVREYSLGMKYKLFLAVAFEVDADMLLLDEPFTSLDIEGQEIAQKMTDEFAYKGKIVIISTHVKDLIQKYKQFHYQIADRRVLYYEDK
ncbi:MAG: ABC transporter ATP-binding protein [Lachnospiraceae bacterium]|nr:ABC transporter ATP-binding protein [Lachnospiraceae bacterium]MDD6448704.1 ABC transporter ATP-binding protein [Lachnospiraceae bacterium]MDD6451921.1 ABC transporter ATP-binding protein [Lachnospiraceae bacterium]MDD6578635.1 ABC transporter ATP-binding protein [Lachnospiraceae bacterium]